MEEPSLSGRMIPFLGQDYMATWKGAYTDGIGPPLRRWHYSPPENWA